MCANMVDIQSVTAENRRGKQEERRRRKKKPQLQNRMSASATQGGHNYTKKELWSVYTIQF